MNNCCPEPLIETTPAALDAGQMIGFTTGLNNLPGVMALIFKQETSIGGFSINSQASLQVLGFPNLKSITGIGTATFVVSGNAVLTSLTAPNLEKANGINVANNPMLPALIFPKLVGPLGLLMVNGNSVVKTVEFPLLATYTGGSGLNISGNPQLVTIDLSALKNSGNTGLTLSANPLLTSLYLTALETCRGNFSITGNTALTYLDMPLVTEIASLSGSLNAAGCTALSTFEADVWLPTNGRNITFTACALSQVSVDHILARAVASTGYVSGTLNLSGGTSATPGTQGQLDKAALIARGVTVITN